MSVFYVVWMNSSQNSLKIIVSRSVRSKKSMEKSTYRLDSMKPKLYWPCPRSKASGPGNIPYWDNALLLGPVVTFIWNLSLCSYTWPEAWKESNVSPLPKVDTPSQQQDFCGINVAPVIAMCFEKIVINWIQQTRVWWKSRPDSICVQGGM